jgi:hypothetical protein
VGDRVHTKVQLVTFKTGRFDVTRETPNESNAFAGQSVLSWLRDELIRHRYECTAPDMEDWGWYIHVNGRDGTYMIGASAEVGYKENDGETLSYDVAADAVLDWTLQIHKQRSVLEKLLGKNKMTSDDGLCALVENIVRSDSRLNEVAVERETA